MRISSDTVNTGNMAGTHSHSLEVESDDLSRFTLRSVVGARRSSKGISKGRKGLELHHKGLSRGLQTAVSTSTLPVARRDVGTYRIEEVEISQEP